ncbi:hypothetical protein BLNAU_8436 [Blattamonas nauphoetae]|uniref:Uncharacterized protein n=1 Tax=Blattamonas nauphoetae TaxID=2049346 RepID=A0ABQ9XYM9_9EUKA|nr:hypothetical protein BLNAU_8436 [Blattamonas nauphoetae]
MTCNWSRSLSPRNIGCPSSRLPMMHPIAHISTAVEYFVVQGSNSGARYHLVATESVESPVELVYRAKPFDVTAYTKSDLSLYLPLGVCDVAEYPKHLSSAVYSSPKAALMYDCDGFLYSAGEPLDHNCRPRDLQEWWAEADLEKRTLHFFIDGVQQQYHFINIHVPLVFAI